jgi:hypothetical protein
VHGTSSMYDMSKWHFITVWRVRMARCWLMTCHDYTSFMYDVPFMTHHTFMTCQNKNPWRVKMACHKCLTCHFDTSKIHDMPKWHVIIVNFDTPLKTLSTCHILTRQALLTCYSCGHCRHISDWDFFCSDWMKR